MALLNSILKIRMRNQGKAQKTINMRQYLLHLLMRKMQQLGKNMKMSNRKFGPNTVKCKKANQIMINNLVDHLIILSTPTNMIQIQISVCVNYFC
ncbi:hypothetical protein LAB52_06165 [Lactobacillus amylovorus GRL1118]|nr:hypothetical protein LAB52_06165 [Lactobacillus amylovorus GRL1118]